MAILKYLLPLLFIAYSFGEIARIKIIPAVNSGLFDLVLALVVLAWIFFVKKKTNYTLKIPILLFSLLAIFSLLINLNNFSTNEIAISSLYLIRFVLYAGIYFVVSDAGKNFKNIQKYMLFSGVIIIFLGFTQYFLYPTLRNLYYLGWDDHMYRLYSTFLDPNFIGAFLVLFLVFVFIMKDKLFSQKRIWLYYGLLLFNFIAIILTFSRGALLMLLVCVITYSFLTKNWKITFGLLTSFVIIFFVLSPKFYVESMNLLRFASSEARLESSKNALVVFKDHPMGIGFNTYRFERKHYENFDWTNAGPSHAGAGVDNSFILVLVTTGVLGLLSFIYLMYKIFKLGYANLKKDKIALVLCVSLVGLVVNSMFINSLLYSFLLFWIFLLSGLTESSSRE